MAVFFFLQKFYFHLLTYEVKKSPHDALFFMCVSVSMCVYYLHRTGRVMSLLKAPPYRRYSMWVWHGSRRTSCASH